MTSSEELALDVSHNAIRRWWQPTSVMVGFLIIVIVVSINIFVLRKDQEDVRALVVQHNAAVALAQKTAQIAAQDAYHNCIITRALEEWSRDLGSIPPPERDPLYRERRNKIFNKLHERLLLVDGVMCVKPPKEMK